MCVFVCGFIQRTSQSEDGGLVGSAAGGRVHVVQRKERRGLLLFLLLPPLLRFLLGVATQSVDENNDKNGDCDDETAFDEVISI